MGRASNRWASHCNSNDNWSACVFTEGGGTVSMPRLPPDSGRTNGGTKIELGNGRRTHELGAGG
jgi:hypothetical protein